MGGEESPGSILGEGVSLGQKSKVIPPEARRKGEFRNFI